MANPIEEFVRTQGVMILDGGLATALEARGCVLGDDLWSARILLEHPDLVRRVHKEFLDAGADCIVGASYQASFPGLKAAGLDDTGIERLLRLSVTLADEARTSFWSPGPHRLSRSRPLIAASVGPYGAMLADGSEYTGHYGLTVQDLFAFHERRWNVLATSGADLMACETLPSAPEVQALLQLAQTTPNVAAWITFSCVDEYHISDGTRIRDMARECDAVAQVIGVGINCTAPTLVEALISEVRAGTTKPILVYPNSGERYDAAEGSWTAGSTGPDWEEAARVWAAAGASAIGGCCRTDCREIETIRRALGL